MEFRTVVDVAQAEWRIEPFDRLLLVGSCFAQNMGLKFEDAQFPTVVNPFGVMYNPVSILHTVRRWEGTADVVVLTLGTNRVYVERATGEIVDNCEKRPSASSKSARSVLRPVPTRCARLVVSCAVRTTGCVSC